MKAFAQVGGMIVYFILGLVQWSAQVDGLHEVLHWPTFFCWIVSTFTAFIPLVGTASGVWGAHAAWGWDWLPSLALFLGIPAFFILLLGMLAALAAVQARRVRA